MAFLWDFSLSIAFGFVTPTDTVFFIASPFCLKGGAWVFPGGASSRPGLSMLQWLIRLTGSRSQTFTRRCYQLCVSTWKDDPRTLYILLFYEKRSLDCNITHTKYFTCLNPWKWEDALFHVQKMLEMPKRTESTNLAIAASEGTSFVSVRPIKLMQSADRYPCFHYMGHD